jgi:hypothetical protein
MPDGGDPLMHDIGIGAERTHALLEQILARLDAIDAALAGRDRVAEIVDTIAPIVGDRAFALSEIYAYAAGAGAAGESLRALLGDSPRSLGKAFARHARRLTLVQLRAGRDGCLWQIVGEREFVPGKSPTPQRAKLGQW